MRVAQITTIGWKHAFHHYRYLLIIRVGLSFTAQTRMHDISCTLDRGFRLLLVVDKRCAGDSAQKTVSGFFTDGGTSDLSTGC